MAKAKRKKDPSQQQPSNAAISIDPEALLKAVESPNMDFRYMGTVGFPYGMAYNDDFVVFRSLGIPEPPSAPTRDRGEIMIPKNADMPFSTTAQPISISKGEGPARIDGYFAEEKKEEIETLPVPKRRLVQFRQGKNKGAK